LNTPVFLPLKTAYTGFFAITTKTKSRLILYIMTKQQIK
jgi:hypothetical protein